MSENKLPAQIFAFSELEKMAQAIAKSGLFGLKTPEQALGLMLLCQAEGLHPAIAARDYHIVDGRPSKKAETLLRDFLASGGRVQWVCSDDKAAEATFSHPAGGSLTIRWDEERAKKAGLWGRNNWVKFPGQMLRSRCISEGVRAIYPAATGGMYVPEEVQDFEETPRNITPPGAPAKSATPLNPPAPEKIVPPAILVGDEMAAVQAIVGAQADLLKSELRRAIYRIVREDELRGEVTTTTEVFQKLMENSKAKFEDIDRATKPASIEKLSWALAKAKSLLSIEKEGEE